MDDQPLTIPEWLCTLVGRLVLDNEALRHALAAAASEEKAEALGDDRKDGEEA